MPDPQSISIAEAARRMGVSRTTVYAWIKRDDEWRIQLTPEGRVPASEIDRLLEAAEPTQVEEAGVLRRAAELVEAHAARRMFAASTGIVKAARDLVAMYDETGGIPRTAEGAIDEDFLNQIALLEGQSKWLRDAFDLEPLIAEFRRGAVAAVGVRRFRPEAIKGLRPFMQVVHESEEKGEAD